MEPVWYNGREIISVTLSERDVAEFMRQMADPPPANEKLRKALREADRTERADD